MEYGVLGRTGVRMSALALGTANFADPTPEDEAKQILLRAVDAGINLIDTGDSYGKGEAERILGRALKGSGLRKEVVITTKVFPPTTGLLPSGFPSNVSPSPGAFHSGPGQLKRSVHDAGSSAPSVPFSIPPGTPMWKILPTRAL